MLGGRTKIRGLPAWLVLLGSPTLCCGQVSISGVTDAAGYGRRVAPGSLATIFGTNLASSKAQAGSFPLPVTLGGASVVIGGKMAPMLYASPSQINFQVPSDLASGMASLVVQAPGGNSSAFNFTVIGQAPAIFQYDANRAVAQNSDAAHTLNSSSAPAASGSVITVYLTGQGAVDNPVTDGMETPDSPLAKATATSSATIGVQNAPIQFLGLTPGFAGLAQANIQVPTLPSGDYPLVITIGGIVSASAVVSVSGTGTYTSPLALVGSVNFTNGGASGIALENNIAYVCGPNNITMVDVTSAAQPKVVGEFGDAQLNGNGTICVINSSVTNPYLVDIVGPLGGTKSNGTTSGVSFAVYDLTTPTAPTLLGFTTTAYTYIVDLSFYANFGFASTSYFTYSTASKQILAQNGDFLAFDFTNPANPQFITSLGASIGSNTSLKPYASVISQLYAYVASTTATGTSTAGTGVLDIVNITTPTAMTSINQIQLAPASILLSFANNPASNLMLVTGNTTGNRNPGTPDFGFTGTLTLAVLDITNPASPVLQNPNNMATSLQVNGAFNTAAFTNGVFAVVANAPDSDFLGPQNLIIVDARHPSNPLVYPFQTQFGFGNMIATTTNYLLAPNILGLNIYLLQFK